MSAGRIRSIKPETLDDEIAVALSDGAWRMWISLRCVADDYGNCRFGDRYLGATVWQNTARDVARERDELIMSGKVQPYVVDDQRYGHLNGWEREQRIDNAGKPRVPRLADATSANNRVVAPSLAANLGESPRTSESLGGSPLDPDHRTTNNDPDQRPTTTKRKRAVTVQPGPTSSTPEDDVWLHFQTVRKRWRKHSRPTLLGTKDRREIASQLATGYDVADLRLAVDGLFGSHWHRENDRLAIAYALRSSNIDGFIDAARREMRPPSRDVDRSDASSAADDTRSLDDPNAIVGERGDEPRVHTFDSVAFAAGFEA